MATIRKRSWTSGGETRTAWTANYSDQTGKRRLKTFPTKKAAHAWLVRTLGEVAGGTHTPDSTSVTIADACGRWLARCEAEGLEPATIRTYRLVAVHHVLPALGGDRLAKLTAPRVHWFRDALLRGDLADGKVRSRVMAAKALQVLRAILNHALKVGLVSQNVAVSVKLGRQGERHKERVTIPTREHVRLILEAAAPSWKALLMTAAFTGLRASELRALTWANVDLKTGTVTVSQRADRFKTIGSPKSASSRRTVPLMAELVRALRERKLASAPGAELMFPTATGGVMSHTNLTTRGFAAAQRRAGLVDADGRVLYSVHSFRHFAASLFIAAGFQPKRVQAILGHSTIGMTLDVYTHLWPNPDDDQERLAAAQMSVLGS